MHTEDLDYDQILNENPLKKMIINKIGEGQISTRLINQKKKML